MANRRNPEKGDMFLLLSLAAGVYFLMKNAGPGRESSGAGTVRGNADQAGKPGYGGHDAVFIGPSGFVASKDHFTRTPVQGGPRSDPDLLLYPPEWFG